MDPNVPRLALPVSDEDHMVGLRTAPIVLVEYGDFECPYCRAASSVVEELCRLAVDHIAFVYRHFPLASYHPHAWHAAEASEAAASQGRFWEMHAALFRHQQALDDEHLESYAAEIGLHIATFTKELREGTFAGKVREHLQSGVDSGVEGTPTFFVNGLRYDGPVGVRQLFEAGRAAHPEIDDRLLSEHKGPRLPRVVRGRSPR